MRWLSTLTATVVAAGTIGALAAPAAAAAPVVDISVEATSVASLPVSPTRPADVDISLVNRGTAPQDASFSFEVPAGWAVTQAFDTPADETCDLTGTTYTCTITGIAVETARSTQLLVTAAPTTPVGSVTTLVVTGGPIGAIDPDPSNNSTQFQLTNVGTSDVVGTISQSATQVPVGGIVTFTVTLTNNGPDPTVGGGGSFAVVSDPTGGFRSATPVGPGTVGEGGLGYFFEHDLAAGASATYVVTWTGLAVGAVGHLRFAADHDPGARDASGLLLLESDDVTVVAPGTGTAPATPGSTAPGATATGGPELAATGTAHVEGALLGALIALATGAGLLLGVRRRRGRHAL